MASQLALGGVFQTLSCDESRLDIFAVNVLLNFAISILPLYIMVLQSSCNSSPWVPTNLRKIGDAQFTDFVEGLGPAQMVGRQVLGKLLFQLCLVF